MKYHIVIEYPSGLMYWSQYGGFTAHVNDAREFSEGHVDMQLRNIHGIGRYGAEHKLWVHARKEPVQLTELIPTEDLRYV